MSSGQQKLVFNTLERAVSDDNNRLQAFLGANAAELMRWMVLATSSEGGASSQFGVTTTPLTAVVLGGLWARPEIGTVNLFIEPGALVMADPDASPSADDSPVKLIVDPGVQVAGTLTLSAGGGGTRIDVIECQRTESVVETQSRDIYDPATGLFTAANVTKVVKQSLTWRIRTGVPGNGYPGSVSGWLPVAIASVPNTATTWNDVILWDVRPLAQDLTSGPAQVSNSWPTLHRTWNTQVNEGAGARLSGLATSTIGAYLAGGELGPSGAGYTNGQIPIQAADFLEGGFVATNNRPWYLWAMYPHGLPRWCRYSPASSLVRVPLTPRGVLVFSQKAPTDGRMLASAAITLPTSLGFTTPATSGTVLTSGAYDAAGTLLDSITTGDGWTRFGKGGVLPASGNGLDLNPTSGATTSTVVYTLADNVTHPVGATMVRLRIATTISFTGGANQGITMQRSVRVQDTTGAEMTTLADWTNLSTGSAAVMNHAFEVDIPLHSLGAAMPTGTPVNRTIEVELGMTGGAPYTFNNQRALIIGWKLGA